MGVGVGGGCCAVSSSQVPIQLTYSVLTDPCFPLFFQVIEFNDQLGSKHKSDAIAIRRHKAGSALGSKAHKLGTPPLPSFPPPPQIIA